MITPVRLLRPALLASVLVALSHVSSAANDALSSSPSGFLQAHAGNPVQWVPWGPEAVKRAQEEKKPLYLAVGSLTHELSRAMNRQTFSNAQVAALLNAQFVCVLIDRDERPDVAAYCQNWLNQKKQLSGWPVNVWLTPELKPYEGATYLPPSEEWGKEGFMNVAQRAAATWKNDPEAQRQKADDALADVAAAQSLPLPPEPSPAALRSMLSAAAKTWAGKQDPAHAGFGDAPRYPEPELLRFLLREPEGHSAALAGLRALARNAMHDPLDGGFYRSSVDAAGRVPTLVKTSLDQARIALAFLDAAAETHAPEFEAAARSALDFAYRHLRTKDGTYIAAIDTTGEDNRAASGWTHEEILKVLGKNEGEAFCRRHGVEEVGNVRPEDDPSSRLAGKNVLQFGEFDRKTAESDRASAAKLAQLRAKRMTAVRDEAVLSGTQGWMLTALASAGRQLKDRTYTAHASELGAALRQRLLDSGTGRLRRLAGSDAAASAGDLLSVASGYAALGDAESLALAAKLQAAAVDLCFDPEHGRFYVTPVQAPDLPLRPVVPEGTAAEPPRAEPVALLSARRLAPAPAELPAFIAPILRSLSAQVEDPTLPSRGDALLALSVVAGGKP